jgi:cytochrome d ubiquinol oxidase subunit I
VSQAVTHIGAGPVWGSFAIVIVVYAVVAWGMLAILLRMRTRWRQEDAGLGRAAAAPVEIPGQRHPRERVQP